MVLQNEQPLVIFHEFLCNEPTVASLKCFLQSSGLQRIPYLLALDQRMDLHGSNSSTLPTPYDLLRKYKRIDCRKLICEDNEEIASFSNERISQKYAKKYQLNFMHYLKQQRSAYALYYLITDQLQQYAQIPPSQMFSACEAALQLITQQPHSNVEQIAHCIAFCEYLEFDTQPMRCYLKLQKLLPTTHIMDGNIHNLISSAEHFLLQQIKQQPEQFPLEHYEALIRLNQQHSQMEWPSLILKHYASENDWFHLLILFQYFDIPLKYLKELLTHFKNASTGQHLLRALTQEIGATNAALTDRNCKRQSSFNRHQQKKNLVCFKLGII